MNALVSAAVINYQTPDLLETAVRSFHSVYPDVPLLIVDNGSRDDSPTTVRRLEDELGNPVRACLLEENRYHGPAMHYALGQLEAPYVYIFDSDTETRRAGFLEAMSEELAVSNRRYGAGCVVTVDWRGFAAPSGISVLASAHMLLRRDIYRTLPPFVHHGLPALENFRVAAERGYELVPFPIEDYVHHLGRGTARRYGYGLGLRSRIDYLLHRMGF
jgi:glycosyltransferase involved in cell wall biosynthesis